VKWIRIAASAFLVAVMLCALLAPLLAPHPYATQFRDSPSAAPDHRFLMGTDEVGRDRFSRLLYATRTSVVLAPGAAAVSVLLALVLSLAGSAFLVSGTTTICLSLPWLFIFLILRAELPLNTTPLVSVALTFGLM
jgi:ABC-type dipeptide/oligopeptide/nickel transport system permease subunit